MLNHEGKQEDTTNLQTDEMINPNDANTVNTNEQHEVVNSSMLNIKHFKDKLQMKTTSMTQFSVFI